jgi:hypothetical protein
MLKTSAVFNLRTGTLLIVMVDSAKSWTLLFLLWFDPESQKIEVARIVEGNDFDTCLIKFDEFCNSMGVVHGMVSLIKKIIK